MEKDKIKTKRILNRYNPVTIKPVIKKETFDKQLKREVQLLEDIQNSKDSLKPSKQKRLSKEIINGTPLKSISKAEKPPFSTVSPRPPSPTPELPEDKFTNSLNKKKSELKHTIPSIEKNNKTMKIKRNTTKNSTKRLIVKQRKLLNKKI